MPPTRRSTSTAVTAPATPAPSALAGASLSPDAIAALLREQRGMIEGNRRLPAINVMPAAVGLFEFTDTNDTLREFEGIILHSHERNVLWDKKYGDDSRPSGADDDSAKMPACSSDDGQNGAPREGFAHRALGRTAVAGDLVSCRGCAYNRFGSGAALISDRNPKGKACANKRSVYVLVEGRAAPMELEVSATSIRALEDYLATLLNHGIPALAVRTIFKQEKQQRGTLSWSVVTFTRGDALGADELDAVMQLRAEYSGAMRPVTQPRGIAVMDPDSELPEGEATPNGAAAGDDDLPF